MMYPPFWFIEADYIDVGIPVSFEAANHDPCPSWRV
jgi:hypothetical protein